MSEPTTSEKTKPRLFKTTVVVEVLHDDPIHWDTLADLHELIESGDCSGYYGTGDTEELDEKSFRSECTKHATDPEFFGLDEETDDE